MSGSETGIALQRSEMSEFAVWCAGFVTGWMVYFLVRVLFDIKEALKGMK